MNHDQKWRNISVLPKLPTQWVGKTEMFFYNFLAGNPWKRETQQIFKIIIRIKNWKIEYVRGIIGI